MLTSAEKKLLHRSFASRQLRAFAEYTEGWFFWCWKDDAGPAWSFSESVRRGWMPTPRGSIRNLSDASTELFSNASVDSCNDSSFDALLRIGDCTPSSVGSPSP